MKSGYFWLISLMVVQTAQAQMAMEEPLIYQLKADEFESSDGNGNPLSWDAQAWVGKDLSKLWFKTEGERLDSETEELEFQALYSRAISPYWDLQAGLRHDFEPAPQTSWAVLGLQGLAPYFFELESVFFLSEDGDLALRLKAEYELLLTQRLILTPEIEMDLYQDDISQLALGSGLSDISAGMRLRYEFRREFAPYVGINWQEKFGSTADYASLHGEEVSETKFVIGIRFWY